MLCHATLRTSKIMCRIYNLRKKNEALFSNCIRKLGITLLKLYMVRQHVNDRFIIRLLIACHIFYFFWYNKFLAGISILLNSRQPHVVFYYAWCQAQFMRADIVSAMEYTQFNGDNGAIDDSLKKKR